jgi:hypothetical protein
MPSIDIMVPPAVGPVVGVVELITGSTMRCVKEVGRGSSLGEGVGVRGLDGGWDNYRN